MISSEQLKDIRRVIEDFHSSLIARFIDPESLPKEKIQELKRRGYIPKDAVLSSFPKDTMLFSRMIRAVELAEAKKMSFGRFILWLKKNPIGLTMAERLAIKHAETRGSQRIVGLGNVLDENLRTVAVDANLALDQQVRAEIAKGISKGIKDRENWTQVVSDLRNRVGDYARDWHRITMTEMQDSLQLGLAADIASDDPDALVAKIPRSDACADCKRLYLDASGKPKIFKLSEIVGNSNYGVKRRFWKPTVEATHPQCVVGGTRIKSPQIEKTFSRHYEGPIVNLRTRSGNELSVTPNHPILTPKGWVASGLLNKGDNVVSARDGYWGSPIFDSNNKKIPALIEDITRSFDMALGSSSHRVKVSPIDFHGDGIGSQVSIVKTNGFLRDRFQSKSFEHVKQELFRGRIKSAFKFLTDCTIEFFRQGRFAPFRCLVCGGSKFGTFGLGHFGIIDFEESRLQFYRNSIQNENTANRSACSVKADGNFLYSQPVDSVELNDFFVREISSTGLFLDEIVDFSLDAFCGHIFNLQTETGWYIGNNILVSNCVCQLVEIPGEDYEFDAKWRLVLKKV